MTLHAAAAIYVGRLFVDLRFDGLMLTATVLAGIVAIVLTSLPM
jgi:hypothetical protein